MTGKTFFLSLFLLIYYCIKISAHYLPTTVFGRPVGGFMNHLVMHMHSKLLSNHYADVKTDWLPQKIDNFNRSDSRTYMQRYMYNTRFYNNSGLAFVMIGGESPIAEYWISYPKNPWLVWAKKYGAACFQPEHRYFGQSQPFKDTSVQSYKYLTIDQVLADLRNFILEMNKKFFSNFAKPRWVIFGCSYPGALAAWFRETNEDITIAAIASSGVVETRVNYFDYAKNVQYVLKTIDPTCPEAVRLGMEEMTQLLYKTGGREQLQEEFNLCEPFPEPPTTKDVQYFLANSFYIFEAFTQYTGGCSAAGEDIQNVCKIMTEGKEPSYMIRIKKVWDLYMSSRGWVNNCNYLNYSDYMETMRDTSLKNEEIVAARSWAWICCTEAGFFQTTNNGKSIFGSSVPLDFYVDQCMDIFGEQYNTDHISEGVHNISLKYGGHRNYKGTRTVFANGSFDPWKSVCCLECNNTINEVYSVMITGKEKFRNFKENRCITGFISVKHKINLALRFSA